MVQYVDMTANGSHDRAHDITHDLAIDAICVHFERELIADRWPKIEDSEELIVFANATARFEIVKVTPEIWAWAGSIPASTTGLVHLPGSNVVAVTAPLVAARAFNNFRRPIVSS